MYSFTLERPATLADAASLAGGGATLLAGGQTLLASMKLRLSDPGQLADLGAIKELSGIRRDGNSLVIGAMTRHLDVADSAEVKAAIPALADLAAHIGDKQVRAMGTIGGSVANNDPAACYPSALLALGATIHTNKRKLVADEFFKGLFETALEADEIITKVSFPIPKKAGYYKFRNQASRFALVGVFVAKRPSEIRVAVTGAGGSGVFRVTSFEEALKKRFSPKSIDGLTVPADGLAGDIHGSSEYRAHLIGVCAKRALEAADK